VTRIGIMQGRLCPPETDAIQAFPVAGWRDEPARAAEAGLATIEWIYDVHGEGANPIEDDVSLDDLKRLAAENGVAIDSVCADWFMARRLVRTGGLELEGRVDRLRWLLGRCARLGATRIVLPFVDDSALLDADDEQRLVDVLGRVLADAEAAAVEVHLETALGPGEYRALLDRLDHTLVKVNYDSGNSASLGFHPTEELAAYGDRIGSVHVKDRVRGGGTVPLGEGDADLPALFHGLRQLGYDGDIVMQVARGVPGDEVEWAIHNRSVIEALLA
jgi:L-ribulose-5-phosphate 3-epimerase